MSKDKKPVAFICHSSIDKERFVLPFAAALREKQGVDAWVDKWEMKPGDKLSRIFDELAKAEVVIPVLSKASVNADWLNAEINSVVDDIVGRSKRIIPVILDGLDKKQFPAIFRGIVYVRGNDCVQAAAEVARGISWQENPEKPQIGSAFENRLARTPQPSSSLADIRQLAAGDADAQNTLGVMYATGEGVPRDIEAALIWFQRAAEQNHVSAQFNLGVLYYKKEDYAKSAEWTQHAAMRGHAQALFNMGALCSAGEGIQQDKAKAAEWYRQAIEQGDVAAQYNLALLYQRGEDVPQDYDEAMKLLRKAAASGYAQAQGAIGEAYYSGKGVSVNHEEAAKWYFCSAKQGNSMSQHNLGQCYHKGEGVAQSNTEAAKWWSCAAEQGVSDAQYNLGLCYHSGEGVAQSDTEAVKWWRCAAEQGNSAAQNNLGVCYADGMGVPQDDMEAYIWFTIAQTGGYPDVSLNLDKIMTKLSADTLAIARAEIESRCKEIERKQAAREKSDR